MYTSHPDKFFTVCCIFIVVGCYGLSACVPVPIYHGNRFEDAFVSIVPGETERSEIRQLLGKPMISNEAWGVDVYREGDEETTIYLPTPIFVTYETSYYSMIVYDDNDIVRALDDGSYSLKAEGFRFYDLAGEYFLLAPNIGINLDLQKQENVEECALYVVPDRASIRINGKYVARTTSNTYFRLRLAPGIHLMSFSSSSRGRAKKSFSCDSGNVIYIQFITKPFGDPKIELTDTPPDELFERQLIIYPTTPSTLIPSLH